MSNTAHLDPGQVIKKGLGKGSLADKSGTATTSAATFAAANGDRTYLLIENVGSADIYVNFGADATAGAGSIKLSAGGGLVYEDNFVPTDSVSVIASSGSQGVTIKEGTYGS